MNDVIEHPAKTLDALVVEWMQAKAQEEAANGRRVEIERQILQLQPAPEQGSTTVKLDSGFKITLTGKLSYRCGDVQALQRDCTQAGMVPSLVPLKTEVKLDETGAKWLRENDPDAWRIVARHVEVKPAKTAISVKV